MYIPAVKLESDLISDVPSGFSRFQNQLASKHTFMSVLVLDFKVFLLTSRAGQFKKIPAKSLGSIIVM